MPNETNQSMPPPSKKKQRKDDNNTAAPVKIAAAPPVSLPPPIMPYHPHLVPSYYPVYPQHPYFLAVHPQPPISPSLSPTITCSNGGVTSPITTTSAATAAHHHPIINKSSTTTITHSPSALTPSYPIYPYPVQLSPQMHPNPPTATPLDGRHNSISSTGTTADEREQARKVSHSAIERRRRERINDKIMQLKDLIPSCAERDNLHKMTILQSAIDYISYLKGLVHDLEGSNKDRPEFQMNIQQQPKSMLPKEAEKFTSQFSLNSEPSSSSSSDRKRKEIEEEKEQNDDDDDNDDMNESEPKQQQQPQQQQQQEDEDGWSSCSSPSLTTTSEKKTSIPPITSLKPMDVMGLTSQKQNSPPKIVIDLQDSHNPPITDRNMNLENILC